MKILITGSTGLLGQALLRQLAPQHDVAGLSRRAAPALEGQQIVCDLLDVAQTAEVIRAVEPEIILHAQAQSNVDACERDPAMARAQNVQTTAHLVQALASRATWLVYVSTDYVFDGHKGASYDEDDPAHPINVYGHSKREAELLVLQMPHGIVARTSTLFGAGRMNFCDQVVSRVQTDQTIEAFVDQITSPTFTEDFAAAMGDFVKVLGSSPDAIGSRVYHMANHGSCSRVAFARRVVELLGGSPELVRGIPMAAQHREAPRPACSALETRYLPAVIGRRLRSWDDALRAYLQARHPSTDLPRSAEHTRRGGRPGGTT